MLAVRREQEVIILSRGHGAVQRWVLAYLADDAHATGREHHLEQCRDRRRSGHQRRGPGKGCWLLADWHHRDEAVPCYTLHMLAAEFAGTVTPSAAVTESVRRAVASLAAEGLVESQRWDIGQYVLVRRARTAREAQAEAAALKRRQDRHHRYMVEHYWPE